MANYTTQKNEEATVCAKGTCVTVYGETAKLVNLAIALAAIIFIGSLIVKSFK